MIIFMRSLQILFYFDGYVLTLFTKTVFSERKFGLAKE